MKTIALLVLAFLFEGTALAQQPCVERLTGAVADYRGPVKEETFTANLKTGKAVKQLAGALQYGAADVIELTNKSDGEKLTLRVLDGAIERGTFVDNFGDERRVNTRRPGELLVGLITYEDAASLSWNGLTEARFAFSECSVDGEAWHVTLTPKDGVVATFASQVLAGNGRTVTMREYHTPRGLDRRIRYEAISTGRVWRPGQVTIEKYRGDRLVESNVLSGIEYKSK